MTSTPLDTVVTTFVPPGTAAMTSAPPDTVASYAYTNWIL